MMIFNHKSSTFCTSTVMVLCELGVIYLIPERSTFEVILEKSEQNLHFKM
jgi:hypothetical protein